MTPEYPIIDCHGHIFPALAGPCGFSSQAGHLLHQQRAMHVHGNQPYRRERDHTIIETRDLWQPEDCSETGRALDTGFRVGRNGRFEWQARGESAYVQFLPPYMQDLSAPPDGMVADMDYSGIGTVVLQNDHIYGDLASYFAQAMQRFPGRFIGLGQVEEAFAYRDDQLAKLEHEVTQHGMRGLYFTMTGFFRDGYRHFPDEALYDPLWKLVAQHALPVFWVHSAKSPAGSYVDEMRRLRRIVERHPTIKHVLVHGVPTSIYCDGEDHIGFPPEVSALLDDCPVYSELLYPIAWGGKMDYPYTRAQTHIRQIYERFGPDKLIWGSDMPNVGRYCTYRQALAYVWNYCDFLTPADRRKIFHGNTLSLFPVHCCVVHRYGFRTMGGNESTNVLTTESPRANVGASAMRSTPSPRAFHEVDQCHTQPLRPQGAHRARGEGNSVRTGDGSSVEQRHADAALQPAGEAAHPHLG